MELIFHDGDIIDQLSAADAVRWIGEAVDAHHRRALVAPPRAHVDLGDGRLVFTTGRLRGSWFGYRSYDTLAPNTPAPNTPAPNTPAPNTPAPGAPAAGAGDQLVVVHDEATGRVRAIAIGDQLGPRRTGAIGAVAVDALAPPDAGVVAIIGSGAQAFTQLWALAAVRDLRDVRVYSRDETRRASFVERAGPLVSGTCHPARDPRTAVEGAEIVILATNSPTPVLDAAWLHPGAHVTTLGPKQRGNAEFGLDLAEAASLLVSDSPEQLGAYEPPSLLVGTPHERRLVSLGAIRAQERPRTAGEETISVFFSVGLAGTEVFLLDRLAASIAPTAPH